MLRGDLGESHCKIEAMMSNSQQLVLIPLLQSILRRFRIQWQSKLKAWIDVPSCCKSIQV
jgi:hypothetical protein